MVKFFGTTKSALEDLVSQQELYELYERVAGEIEAGLIDRGVWTKAFADAGGDEGKAKAVYIDLMVERLILANKAQSELENSASQIESNNQANQNRSKRKISSETQGSNFFEEVSRPMSKKWWVLYCIGVVPLMFVTGPLIALIWPDLFSPFTTISFLIALISGAIGSAILASIVSALFGWDEF